MWKKTETGKVSLAVDMRVLIVVVAVAVYGAIKLFLTFHGVDVRIMPDTAWSSSGWPHAAGRAWVRVYDWWGLKGAGFVVEPRIHVDDGSQTRTRQSRWMIIASTGPKEDQWGKPRIPRPLFVDDEDGTFMTITDMELRWFDFGDIKSLAKQLAVGRSVR